MNAFRILVLPFCICVLDCALCRAKAAQTNKSQAEYDFYLSGNDLYRDGKYDQAISAFRKSCDLNGDYYFARINLGVALARKGQFKEAVREFTFCIEKKWGTNTDRFVFYHNRALAAQAAGDARSALKDKAALKELDPLVAEKLRNSSDYVLMDAEYVEARNKTERDRLLDKHRESVTSGKVIVDKVGDFEKSAQEYAAIGLIEGTLEQVVGILGDFKSYPKFMPNVSEITVQSSDGPTAVVDYKLGLPLGIVKKYRLRFYAKKQDSGYQLIWKKLPWPELKSKDTVVDTYGQWIVEDFPGKQGHVLAYYRVYTDPGKIPLGMGWIADALTKQSMPTMFKKMQERVKELK